jgi:hypothetical protein
MTGLTQLELTMPQTAGQQTVVRHVVDGHTLMQLVQPARPQPPLHLSGVQLLKIVGGAHLFFLDSLIAPQLQFIRRTSTLLSSMLSDTTLLNSTVVCLDQVGGPDQQAALMERCAQGVFRCCSHLALLAPTASSAEVSSALEALGKYWRPDPSLVDGSSPHVQDQAAASAGWHLALINLPINWSSLAALPQGLTRLSLM